MSYHICYSDEENQTDENTRENFDRAADLLKWEAHHDFKHYNMKKLTIEGFQVEAKFTRYIRRVMEAAMNLEVVSLRESHPCLRCEFLPSTVSTDPQGDKSDKEANFSLEILTYSNRDSLRFFL